MPFIFDEEVTGRFVFPDEEKNKIPEEQDNPLRRGYNAVKSSLGLLGDLAKGDYESAAKNISEQARYAAANPGSEASIGLQNAWQSGEGITGGISNVASEIADDYRKSKGLIAGIRSVADNAQAMGSGIVAQVPNMVLPMAGMIGGGVAGSTVGPMGTVGGAWAGASAGNAAVGTSEAAMRQLQKAGINPNDEVAVANYLRENGDSIIQETGVKGAVIGAVDTATMGVGSQLLKAPLKAGASTFARNATAAALEPAGEFAGEYAGSYAATGEADAKDAALEAVSSLGQSAITFAGQKAYANSKSQFETAKPKVDPIPDILDSPSVDDAIAAAQAGIRTPETLPTPDNFTAEPTGLKGSTTRGDAGPGFDAGNILAESPKPAQVLDDLDFNNLLQAETRDLNTLRAQYDQERIKQQQLDQIPELAAEQNETQKAVERAATLDAPSAMAQQLQRLREPAQPPQTPAQPAGVVTSEPRIVERTEGMKPMPLELAELQVDMVGGEVVRVQNRNGKFGYVVIPEAPKQGTPEAVWMGRRGDGYVTQADAYMALPSRQKTQPDLNWQVDRMPSGRFQLAGYSQTQPQEDANGKETSQASQATEEVLKPSSQVAQLQKQLDATEPMSEAHHNLLQQLRPAVTKEATDAIDSGNMPVYAVGNGLHVAISPSAQSPGKFQVTRYSDKGIIGDSQYNSVDDAVSSEGLMHKARVSPDVAQQVIGKSLEAESKFNEQNPAQGTNTPSAQAPGEAPQVVAGNAAPAADVPAARSGTVESVGLNQTAAPVEQARGATDGVAQPNNTPTAPQGAPNGVTSFDYTKSDTGTVLVKGDPAEVRVAFPGAQGVTKFADGKAEGILFGAKSAPDVIAKIESQKVSNELKAPEAQPQQPAQPQAPADPARAQRLKNDIQEGELTLRAGSFNGRKMSADELGAVQRSVDSSKAKLAALGGTVAPQAAAEPVAPKTFDELPDLTPDQREVLDPAVSRDIEVQFQKDLVTELKRKRGLLPDEQDNELKRSPFKTFLITHGVSDKPGDVVGDGNAFKANQIIPTLFRKTGIGMDELVDRAVEAGFISERDRENGDGVGKLVEMIRTEVAGLDRHLPIDMQDESAEQQAEQNLRLEVEDDADALGLVYDNKTSTKKLQGMITRIRDRIKRAPKNGLLKPDRILKNARDAAMRIEQKRAQLEAQNKAFEELSLAEQDAALDVFVDEDGIATSFMRTMDVQAAEQWFSENPTWTNENGTDTRSNQDSGQVGAPVSRVAQESAGSDQAIDPVAQQGSAQEQGQEGLESYTEADVKAEQDRIAQIEKDKAKADQDAEAKAKAERIAKEIQQRQEASAENFQLGQSAEESLSGQGSIFDAPAPKPPVKQSKRLADSDALNVSFSDFHQQAKILFSKPAGAWVLTRDKDGSFAVLYSLGGGDKGKYGSGDRMDTAEKAYDSALNDWMGLYKQPESTFKQVDKSEFDGGTQPSLLTSNTAEMSAADHLREAARKMDEAQKPKVEAAAAQDADKAEDASTSVDFASSEIQADSKNSHEFRLEVEKLARDRYANKDPVSVDVKSTGDKIYISWASAKHILRDGLPDWKTSIAVLHMEELAKNAQSKGDFQPDYKGRKDPSGVYVFKTSAKFDGVEHAVEITVRQHSDGKRYYDHLVVENKTPAGLPESSATSITADASPTPPFARVDSTVPQSAAESKPSNGYAIIGDPSKAEAQAVQNGIEGKTAVEAAEFIAKNAPKKDHRAIAERVVIRLKQLEAVGSKFTMNVSHVGGDIPDHMLQSGVRGVAMQAPNDPVTHIWVNGADVTGSVGVSYETVLHELVHAATQKAIDLGEHGAPGMIGILAKELNAVLGHVYKHVQSKMKSGEALNSFEQAFGSAENNSLTNMHEMVAWTLTNKETQDYLETIPYKKTTAWGEFVAALRRFFGMSAEADTVLSEVLRISDKLMGLDATDLLRASIQQGVHMRKNYARSNPDGSGRGIVNFSRTSVMTGQQLPQTWQAPDATKLDDVIYSMQDKHVDTKRVTQAVRAAIGTIADNINPYMQEELYHGRAAMATKEFLERQVRPLMIDMQARKVDMSDFEEYLHNRHAQRRNEQVAKVNLNMPDGGSGIKTADAAAYLAGLTPVKEIAYKALAVHVDKINRDTRALLVASGLEKQSTIDAWQAAYGDEYVPLMREEMDDGVMGIGQGFSVRGSSSKRAMGSDKPVANIIANIALQREKAITRSEKQRIGHALYGMVLSAPNPDFWLAVDPKLQQNPAQVMDTSMQLISLGIDPADAESIAREPTTRYINPITGLVSERINPAMRSASNVLAVRIDGEDKYVFFNARDDRAMRMAKSLKNLDSDQLGSVMGTVAKMTRYFSAINTQYNPIFGVTNIARDVQTAMLNLESTALKGSKAAVMKHILPALRGIYIDLRDHRAGKQPTSAYAQIFEEFQREGGATGYRDMYANAQERADAIKDELADINAGKLKQFGNGVMGWLSDYNESMENAVRVSAYKVGLEQGLSKQQAASLAKNLTVNFNRKGQVALQAGALYAFFNASVQGTARIAETLLEGGKLSSVGKKIMTGGLLLGTMQALLLAAAGFDDDEPPDFVRERSLVIPIGDKKYVSIPMPLGFHVIPNLARIPTEWAIGGFKNTPKRIGQMVGLFADAFNPIGSAGLSLQTLTPTIIDPLAALSENKDFTGKPIAKKDFDPMRPTAGHTRAKDSATPWAKFISEAVNFATGGTDYKPGLASPTPDQIDYLIGQVTGGVGREVGKMTQVVGGGISGEEVPLHKIPLVGRFIGTTEGQSAEASRFYNNLRSIGEHKVEIDGLRHDRKGAEAAEYQRENPEAMLVPMATKLQAEVSKLNKTKRELLRNDGSKDRVKLIDMQITSRMRLLNQRVLAMREKEAA